jgi:putative acetyltransferase
MEIRLARAEDTGGIVETIRAVYEEYGLTWEPGAYHADLYDLQGFYFDKGHLFWVAELEGRVVGTVALELFPALPGCVGETVMHGGRRRIAGADCSLERLYVHPEARRRGIGAALAQRTLEEAAAQGRRRMELWSDKRFIDAHRLYLRFGAKVVGERICHDPDQSPEWGLAIPIPRGESE